MKVNDLMETDVHTCDPKTNLQTVATQMWEKNCGSIALVDSKGKPVGIITDRDIAMGAALNHKPLWELTAQQITNHRKVFTCSAQDSVQTALNIMRTNKIRRLPVVDKNGQLAGILSIDKMINVAKPKSLNDDELAFNDVMTSLKNICRPRVAA
jgi:CBS domain-containing protein